MIQQMLDGLKQNYQEQIEIQKRQISNLTKVSKTC